MYIYIYIYTHIYIYIYIYYTSLDLRVARVVQEAPEGAHHLGDSKDTVRGYCLDIPRFEESPNN